MIAEDACPLWSRLPGRGVVYIGAVNAVALAERFEAATDRGPAGLIWRPAAGTVVSAIVSDALAELERVATEIFPAWLPGAEGVTTRNGANEEVVRRLALRAGMASAEHYGPYLAELAARSLRPSAGAVVGFTAEARARGVARALAAGLGQNEVVLAIELPDGLDADSDPEAERALAAAADFLSRHGQIGVWLTGPELMVVDWVPTYAVDITERAVGPEDGGEPPVLPPCWYPPVAGKPHPASGAEQALERALADQPWAVGRSWNQHFAAGPLVPPVRVDLAWMDERLMVEIDGPEHRDPYHYETDRRRDLQLTLAGYTVVRITNDYLADDLARVVGQLGQLVHNRRGSNNEEHGEGPV